jgi:lysophospholipase L1-like esterase
MLGGTHDTQRIRTDVKQTRLGPVVFAIVAAASAGYLVARTHYMPYPGAEHRYTRQLILHYTFSRLDDSIIVLGDSLVEAARLPTSACGHPFVNAGLNGASMGSDLGGWLAPALANKQAFAIIVSLGVNDALTAAPISKQVFAERYASLLAELSKLTTRLFIVEIAPLETRGRMTADTQKVTMATIQDYRSVLPEVATQTHATLLKLPEMISPFTIDGVHLNVDGYRAWEQAVTQGASQACGQ